MELGKMLDLVRGVRWRRRILTLVGRILALVDRLLGGMLVAVMSYRPSGDRSSNESSTS
jgi:hypothetical protein